MGKNVENRFFPPKLNSDVIFFFFLIHTRKACTLAIRTISSFHRKEKRKWIRKYMYDKLD